MSDPWKDFGNNGQQTNTDSTNSFKSVTRIKKAGKKSNTNTKATKPANNTNDFTQTQSTQHAFKKASSNPMAINKPRTSTTNNSMFSANIPHGYSNFGQPAQSRNTQSNTNQTPLSRLQPQERETVIKKAYKDILGRDPKMQEIAKYKYSMITENALRQELLNGKEHKNLIERGNKYQELNLNKEHLEQKVSALEDRIKSMELEFQTLQVLLKEKNRHIQQLREHINLKYKESAGAFPVATLAEQEPQRSFAVPDPATSPVKTVQTTQSADSNSVQIAPNKSKDKSVFKKLLDKWME